MTIGERYRILLRYIGVSEKKYEKIFFLHIPKTAGTAFNYVFLSAVPSDRYFEHMESRRELFLSATNDGLPFFASGHFTFEESRSLVRRGDVFSVTIVRDPVQHLISHLKWVKAHGNIKNPERYGLLSPEIAEVAARLWNTSLTNLEKLDDIMSTPTGTSLFDNLQTRYLADSHPGVMGYKKLKQAEKNIKKFNMIFALEDISRAVQVLDKKISNVAELPRKNEAYLDEEIDLGSEEIRDFYSRKVKFDELLYMEAREYSRNRFLKRPHQEMQVAAG